MGRRWLRQLCTGKIMVCLDSRNAEATFPAAVVVPESRACPALPGIKSPFCQSLALVQTSAIPSSLFWPGRSLCVGCPTEGSSLFPTWLVLMSLVCAGKSAGFQHVKVRRGSLLGNYAMVSVPRSYGNILILVK